MATIFDPTPDEFGLLRQIKQRESGGNYQLRNAATTASGAYQFVNDTWRRAAQATGVGGEYTSARDAPPWAQDTNALWLLRNTGANSPASWAASGPYMATNGQPVHPPGWFDLEGARRDNHSDDEIINFLAKRNRYDVGGAQSRGLSQQQILQNLLDLNNQPKPIAAPKKVSVPPAAPITPVSIPLTSRAGSPTGPYPVMRDVGASQPLSNTEQILTSMAGLPMVAGNAIRFGRGLTRAGLTPEAEGQEPSWLNKVGAYSDLVSGGLGMTAPLTLPLSLARYPITTLMSLGAGAGLGTGAEEAARYFNAPEEVSEAAGTTGNLVGGAMGATPLALGAGGRWAAGKMGGAWDALNPYMTGPNARTAAHSVIDFLPIPKILHPLVHAAVERMQPGATPKSGAAAPAATGEPVPMGLTGALPGGLTYRGARVEGGPTSRIPGPSMSPMAPAGPAPALPPLAQIGSTGELVTPPVTPTSQALPPLAPIGTTGQAGGPVQPLTSGTPLGTLNVTAGTPTGGITKAGMPTKMMPRKELNRAIHAEAQDLNMAPLGNLPGAPKGEKIPSGYLDILSQEKFGKPYRELSDQELGRIIDERMLHDYKVK